MKKRFLIEQPPISNKYKLIVDKLTPNENFGYTNDIDKIEYNLDIIGKDFNERFDIHNLFSNKGTTCVIDVGRFIVILGKNKNKSKGKMSFFDFKKLGSISEIRSFLEMEFSERIIEEWFKVYYLLVSEFEESEDLVELITVPV
jgi:hypothetical protein